MATEPLKWLAKKHAAKMARCCLTLLKGWRCPLKHGHLKRFFGFYPIWNYFPQGSVDCKPHFSGSIHISMPLLNCHGHWPIGASWKTGFVWRSQIFEASCGYSHEERPLCEPWQLTFHKVCLHILAVMVAGPLLLGGIWWNLVTDRLVQFNTQTQRRTRCGMKLMMELAWPGRQRSCRWCAVALRCPCSFITLELNPGTMRITTSCTTTGTLLMLGSRLPRTLWSSGCRSSLFGSGTLGSISYTVLPKPGNHGLCKGNHPLLWPNNSG